MNIDLTAFLEASLRLIMMHPWMARSTRCTYAHMYMIVLFLAADSLKQLQIVQYVRAHRANVYSA